MLSVINHDFIFVLEPFELDDQIKVNIQSKVDKYIQENKYTSKGIIKEVKNIINIRLGKIDNETFCCKVNAQAKINILIPKKDQVLDCIVHEVTLSGLFCHDEYNLMNIFIVTTESKKKYEIGDLIKVKLIKCKFQKNEWIILATVV